MRRHTEYYAMGEEEEEGIPMQPQSGKFKPMAMGSRIAPSVFRMKMDFYLDKHGEEEGIMAPCGCMLTRPWMAQGCETDESPKAEGGLGGHGAAPVGRGGRPGRGGPESQGVQGKYGEGMPSGMKRPDWGRPAEGNKAGKEYDEEEEDQDED